jgi:hypothetical protein
MHLGKSVCARWGCRRDHEQLDREFRARLLSPVGQMGGVGHEDYYPRDWGLYILIRERVAELRLRDYLPTIQTIAVGFGLIGLAQALRLLPVLVTH